jgi:hypothetical protein
VTAKITPAIVQYAFSSMSGSYFTFAGRETQREHGAFLHIRFAAGTKAR